jgi:hypothetical protein
MIHTKLFVLGIIVPERHFPLTVECMHYLCYPSVKKGYHFAKIYRHEVFRIRTKVPQTNNTLIDNIQVQCIHTNINNAILVIDPFTLKVPLRIKCNYRLTVTTLML